MIPPKVREVLDAQAAAALVTALEKGHLRLVETGAGLFLRASDLENALAGWQQLGEPGSAGEAWGPIVAETWRMTIMAASRIGGRGDCVVLREQAGQRFLYGRGMRPADVEARRTRKGPGERVFVCDRGGNVLGLGFLEPASEGVGIRPLVDLGWYLREGG